LFTGDVNGALGDAEHLEAAARGSVAKHEVIVDAAREFLLHGQSKSARRLFERALRYLPADVGATFGLARCFLADGNTRRALVLLGRAAELVQDESPLHSEIQLELAKALASHAGDLPQAIARAQRVTGRSKVLVEARALEARWRAQLGDVAGAAVAFGRLKDSIELLEQRSNEFEPWLLEAGRFFEGQGDDRVAERQLALALRLAPRDHEVLAQYKSVAGRLGHKPLAASRANQPVAASSPARDATASVERRGSEEQLDAAPMSQVEEIASGRLDGEPPVSSVPPTQIPVHPTGPAALGLGDSNDPGLDEIGFGEVGMQDVAAVSGELEVEAEDLMRRLMAGGELSPNQYKSLSDALTRLGRDDELHAAGWGLFEDAEDELRRAVALELVPLLERLLARSDDEVARGLFAAQLAQVRRALE
jgi:tetratricopeptide (TPR) repeat protein